LVNEPNETKRSKKKTLLATDILMAISSIHISNQIKLRHGPMLSAIAAKTRPAAAP